MFRYFIKALAYFSALTLRFREIENKISRHLAQPKFPENEATPGRASRSSPVVGARIFSEAPPAHFAVS